MFIGKVALPILITELIKLLRSFDKKEMITKPFLILKNLQLI